MLAWKIMIKSKKGLLARKFGDKHIIVAIDDKADEFHNLITLNETGLFIWQQLQNGSEFSSLLESITNTYDVDKETASADLDEFLASAKKAGIIDD